MNHHLSAAFAQSRIADMHKAAASCRSVSTAPRPAASQRAAVMKTGTPQGEANPMLEACRQPLEPPAHGDVVAHERQRALVCASLLLSRHEDPPTHRRSA
jgi:hypothetical protein